jgi:hypothetical protein
LLSWTVGRLGLMLVLVLVPLVVMIILDDSGRFGVIRSGSDPNFIKLF